MQEKKNRQSSGFISFYNSVDGFALPSILFLVTILSLVILSILTVKYLHQQIILFDTAKVKTDYAAVSGIHRIIVEMNTRNTPLMIGEEVKREYNHESNESSEVVLQQWGLYYKVISKGKVGKVSSERIALIGSQPSSQFDNALYFANSNHQIVLTGTTTIKGDIVTGPSGVTIGTLSDMTTPSIIPVKGKIKKESKPEFSLKRWQKVVDNLNDLLDQKYLPQVSPDAIVRINANGVFQIDSSTVPDNVRIILIEGDASVSGELIRRSEPLYILVSGNVVLLKDTYVSGFVFIGSKKLITVSSSAQIENAILFSKASIDVETNTSVTAQLFAPAISIHSSTNCFYPSTMVSFQPVDPKIKQEIRLENSSYVEGTVALLAKKADDKHSVIDIQSGAKVRGAVLSEKEITLDGSVEGAVLARDFYFYSSPTTYLGWIRTGQIDRSALPVSFLTPIGFAETDKLDILNWL